MEEAQPEACHLVTQRVIDAVAQAIGVVGNRRRRLHVHYRPLTVVHRNLEEPELAGNDVVGVRALGNLYGVVEASAAGNRLRVLNRHLPQVLARTCDASIYPLALLPLADDRFVDHVHFERDVLGHLFFDIGDLHLDQDVAHVALQVVFVVALYRSVR